MPSTLVLTADLKDDTEDDKILRGCSAFYYWCSAHEFTNAKNPNNRYLFQYQVYIAEGFGGKPRDVIQQWTSNRNQLRDYLIDFISAWKEHKRFTLDPFHVAANAGLKLDKDNIENFATAVGHALAAAQSEYWTENIDGGFDVGQKEYWRTKVVEMRCAELINEMTNQKSTKSTKPIKIKNKSNKSTKEASQTTTSEVNEDSYYK